VAHWRTALWRRPVRKKAEEGWGYLSGDDGVQTGRPSVGQKKRCFRRATSAANIDGACFWLDDLSRSSACLFVDTESITSGSCWPVKMDNKRRVRRSAADQGASPRLVARLVSLRQVQRLALSSNIGRYFQRWRRRMASRREQSGNRALGLQNDFLGAWQNGALSSSGIARAGTHRRATYK
jgi:hypothetical protein